MPKPRKAPCNVNTTSEHYDAMLWCIKNGIVIKPLPKQNGVYLEIYVKKRLTISPESYTNCEASQKIWDIYVKLRKKYDKKL